jgi:hypothetical protein
MPVVFSNVLTYLKLNRVVKRDTSNKYPQLRKYLDDLTHVIITFLAGNSQDALGVLVLSTAP